MNTQCWKEVASDCGSESRGYSEYESAEVDLLNSVRLFKSDVVAVCYFGP